MASASEGSDMKAVMWTVVRAVLLNVAIVVSLTIALKALADGPRWEWLDAVVLLVPIGLHFFLWPRLSLIAKIGISIVSVPLSFLAVLWAVLFFFGDAL